MNNQTSLTTSGSLTFIGQIAFALDANGLGLAASAAALPMLLPMLAQGLRKRRQADGPYCTLPMAA